MTAIADLEAPRAGAGDLRDSLPFELTPDLEAHEPPEARGTGRDDVRLLVSRSATGQVSQEAFGSLPELLLPGDLLVVNNSATIPAAVPVQASGNRENPLTIHFSTALPDGDWLVELRSGSGAQTVPSGSGGAGRQLTLPGGAVLTLTHAYTARLWRARLSTAVVPYLLRHGHPIRYSYVPRDWPIDAYQTVFAAVPGSAEMPGAARPFTGRLVAGLVSRGVAIAPVTLHTGVSSLEGTEDPYPEHVDVPPATARLVNLTRRAGGRVIAVGTTVVRALETAALAGHQAGSPVAAVTGWTSHVVTRRTGVSVVDGLLTGLHEPRSTHLWMLAAFAGDELLARCYATAIASGYRWHEFGDVHLLLP